MDIDFREPQNGRELVKRLNHEISSLKIYEIIFAQENYSCLTGGKNAKQRNITGKRQGKNEDEMSRSR